MRFSLRTLLGTTVAIGVVIGVAIGGLLYVYWDQAVPIAALAINYARYWSAPAGTLATEVAQTGAAAQPSGTTAAASPPATPNASEGDWPSYNRTLMPRGYHDERPLSRNPFNRSDLLSGRNQFRSSAASRSRAPPRRVPSLPRAPPTVVRARAFFAPARARVSARLCSEDRRVVFSKRRRWSSGSPIGGARGEEHA